MRILFVHQKSQNSVFIQQYLVMGDFKTLLQGSVIAVNAGLTEPSDFIKNILICVPKINEGLTGVERHEGE